MKQFVKTLVYLDADISALLQLEVVEGVIDKKEERDAKAKAYCNQQAKDLLGLQLGDPVRIKLFPQDK